MMQVKLGEVGEKIGGKKEVSKSKARVLLAARLVSADCKILQANCLLLLLVTINLV